MSHSTKALQIHKKKLKWNAVQYRAGSCIYYPPLWYKIYLDCHIYIKYNVTL